MLDRECSIAAGVSSFTLYVILTSSPSVGGILQSLQHLNTFSSLARSLDDDNHTQPLVSITIIIIIKLFVYLAAFKA